MPLVVTVIIKSVEEHNKKSSLEKGREILVDETTTMTTIAPLALQMVECYLQKRSGVITGLHTVPSNRIGKMIWHLLSFNFWKTFSQRDPFRWNTGGWPKGALTVTYFPSPSTGKGSPVHKWIQSSRGKYTSLLLSPSTNTGATSRSEKIPWFDSFSK